MFSHIRSALGAAFSLVFAAWLFKANLTTDDTGIVAGLILIGSGVAALILPKRWWPVATVIALAVIASEIVRRESPLAPDFLLVTLAILAFAAAGIAAAAGARHLLSGTGKNA